MNLFQKTINYICPIFFIQNIFIIQLKVYKLRMHVNDLWLSACETASNILQLSTCFEIFLPLKRKFSKKKFQPFHTVELIRRIENIWHGDLYFILQTLRIWQFSRGKEFPNHERECLCQIQCKHDSNADGFYWFCDFDFNEYKVLLLKYKYV